MPETDLPPEVDTTKPHSARIYDFLLGGKDHFAADRQVAEQTMAAWPSLRVAARENRAFIGRAVRALAEAGVDQFLDIGSGLPTARNVHEVAQAVNPAARVVYCDNDPIVLAHARALLTSTPAGKCAYIHADLREPEKILADPATRETLDFTRPIALVLTAVLHFLLPEDHPERIVRTLVDPLAPGSYVIATHGTGEYAPREQSDGVSVAYCGPGLNAVSRDSAEFADLAFAGLELIPPGVVPTAEWRPNPPDAPRPSPAETGTNAGVALKR